MQYWMVVWNKVSGDFKNALINSEAGVEGATSEFETQHKSYRVIHIGEGKTPPKTYRSLPYVEIV